MAIKCAYGLTLLALSFCSSVDALQCYQCADVISSNSLIKTGGHTDSNCKSATAIGTKTCRTGEVCGYLNGKVDVSVNLLVTKVDATITLNIRDCMAVASGTSMKCYRNQYYTDIINAALSFINSLQIADVTFDGDVCFCDKNRCKSCDSKSVEILGLCVPIWALGVAGGGVGLIIILMICCCCCCCKNNQSVQQPVIVQTPGAAAQGAFVVSNPGYQMYQPQQQGAIMVSNPGYQVHPP